MKSFGALLQKNQNFVMRRNGKVHLTGNCHGNLKSEHQLGHMLDVGIDSAKELYDEHFLFSFEDVCYHMEGKQRYIADHHKER